MASRTDEGHLVNIHQEWKLSEGLSVLLKVIVSQPPDKLKEKQYSWELLNKVLQKKKVHEYCFSFNIIDPISLQKNEIGDRGCNIELSQK